MNTGLPKAATKKAWARCPVCGAKTVLYYDTAECRGVMIKCSRGCGAVFELVVKDGRQVSGR